MDNPDKFFKIREIQNSVISERKDLFYNNSSNTSSDDAEVFYKPFDECLNILKIFYLVEVIEVPSEKKESLMVEAYRLSNLVKLLH